ncbi:glycerophosphoryl diester phosphodiesterase membrane domain-containing protein [Demequina capsici]|uniref:Glycerophosphoryl diester phosphodiesterase membrane domain-containing protein n=1 Tax=Demequina capsici TaxID=3075620 RepID=A0AA96FBK3_9MICO|nr:glycerophosphoryl diester phosphodiesterase membrane domain-containing protein [Demequina sp. PMTSA13]WNM26708.1 glycerophosphoryl diester phosphodiesterase membrane domain-containing protein [Demequina sp. PMTSA13]
MSDSGQGTSGAGLSGGSDGGSAPVFVPPSAGVAPPPPPYPGAATGSPVQAFPAPPAPPGAPVPPPAHPRPLDAAAMLRPGIIPLRPLTFGELLDGPLKAIRHNPKVMLGINALVSALAMVVMFGMGYSYYASLFDSAFIDVSSSSAMPFSISDVVLLLVGSLLGSLVLLVSTAVTSVSFSRSVIGERIGPGEAVRRGFTALPALLVQTLMLGIAGTLVIGVATGAVVVAFRADLGLGLAALVLLGLGAVALIIWVAIKVSLAVPVVVLERMGPFRALRRSWRLTTGRFWMILGVLVVAGLITSVIQNVLAVPVSVLLPLFMFTADPGTAGPLYVAVLALATYAGALLSIVYLGGVSAGLYTDQRMRQEGFDLTLQRAVQERAAR